MALHRLSHSRASKQGVPSKPTASTRPALVTIHPNTRLEVTMTRLTRSKSDLASLVPAEVGQKRKRGTTSSARSELKRRKSSPVLVSDEEEHAASEEGDEMDQDEAELDSSDEFLLHEAPKWHLSRLRKEVLVRLYDNAGLDAEYDDDEATHLLKKSTIVGRIMAARPSSSSSPRYQAFENSSNDGGAEEESDAEAIAPNPKRAKVLKRRATENLGFGRTPTVTTRSSSMQDLSRFADKRGNHSNSNKVNARRRGSHRPPRSPPSSPSEDVLPPSPSPRKTRAQAQVKGKDKQKHVEFTAVDSDSLPPSDETDCDDDQDQGGPSSSTPARRPIKSASESVKFTPIRTRLQRRAQFEGSFRESSTEDENAEEEPSEEESASDADQSYDYDDGEESLSFDSNEAPRSVSPASSELTELEDEEDDILVEEDDEDGMDVDDEDQTATLTKPAHRQNSSHSAKSRCKPPPRDSITSRGIRLRRPQTFTPPSDGDRIDLASDDEETEEPIVLRNGKVVGEIVEEDDDDPEVEAPDEEIDELTDESDGENQEAEEDGDDEDKDEEDEDEADEDEGIEAIDLDVEESEDTDEDVDLGNANLKSLVRLRRDRLVGLCKKGGIEVDGTKNQLAKALLHQWRTSQSDMRSSSPSQPSSGSTARAPSVRKPIPRQSTVVVKRNHVTPVVLAHPNTPPLTERPASGHADDIELDLESLGLEDREIPPDRITKLEKIGSGGFKDVYVGKYRSRKVAIAEFRGSLNSMDIKELKLLRDFNHPNVVKFLGVSIPEDTRVTPVMIISELCSNGDLFDYVRNVPPPSLRKVVHLMLDIAKGIQYLHLRTPSVIHRDLKSSNILITSRVTGKIADFGLARIKQSTRSMVRSLVGTVNWQAPELWHAHPKYDHKVDVFSCALVFWEMLQWHNPKKIYPWEGMNEHAIYDIVGAKKQRPSMSGARKLWSPDVIDLVERMWVHDPNNRPTISEVVEDLEHILRNL